LSTERTLKSKDKQTNKKINHNNKNNEKKLKSKQRAGERLRAKNLVAGFEAKISEVY
jgi:hypothetical protein